VRGWVWGGWGGGVSLRGGGGGFCCATAAVALLAGDEISSRTTLPALRPSALSGRTLALFQAFAAGADASVEHVQSLHKT